MARFTSESSSDNKPKCDKNSLAVWKSWQAGGGVHSSKTVDDCSWAIFDSTAVCLPINCDNISVSLLMVSSWDNTDSRDGMDWSLQRYSLKLSHTEINRTYTLHCITLSTLSGKYFCLTWDRTGVSCITTGRQALCAWYFVPDLCLGKCLSCIVQACLPNGPRISKVTVGCGS